jgi:hypothetical protein
LTPRANDLWPPAAQDLAEALKALEAAVCGGDLPALPALEIRIEHAAAELAATGAPAGVLEALRQQGVRVAPMLEAAQQGIASARLRLHEVVQAREGIGTYDRAGARRVLTPSGAARPAPKAR